MESRGKILVVDDDKTITTLLEARLSDYGFQVMSAFDGIEAMEKYIHFEPDLIILDILMPRMDGYTFVLEFKKIANIKTTPIIILTSRENMQDIFEMEGINDYMVKPFKMEDLLRKINKRLISKEKKILVVDDEVDLANLIEYRLTQSGYDVFKAYDGLQGLTAAQRMNPDLMVIDVMMPKLDGFRVCRMLKFDEKFKNIQIVLLSSLRRENDRILGKEVGADAYLTKPYNGKVLLQTMKELLWD